MNRVLAILAVCLALCLPSLCAQPHSNALTWSWSQGAGDPATGFHVWRSATAGGEMCGTCTPYATISGPTSTSFTDSAVIAGQSWFYVVTAYNPGGDSVPSNEITCTTPFQAPATPPSLSGTVK